jgi:hypothetical protein
VRQQHGQSLLYPPAFLGLGVQLGPQIAHGELARLIDYPAQFIGPVEDRIATWCRAQGKLSLVLLVINFKGKPSEVSSLDISREKRTR